MQAYAQLGDVCPDVSSDALKGMWTVTQSLVAAGRISAGHDISDGGIITTLCEMAFAGESMSWRQCSWPVRQELDAALVTLFDPFCPG